MGRRKAAVSVYTNGTNDYTSLVNETQRLILEPKWVSIGLACHIANTVFEKTLVQFHKDLFKEYFKRDEREPMSLSGMSNIYVAYRFRELCSPEMRTVSTSKAPFYFAAQDKSFKEGRITADAALKKIMKQEGGVRRLTGQLSQIVSAAALLEHHPELLQELNPTTVQRAIKALSSLIMALKKVTTKRTRKAA